ncbi:Bro-N domain-containing protein [Acinetobacter piscicola]|uniref:BRO-N domain-containing protein n=1 Tax=Acinetobacter TaxID=469 RepID=UPI002576B957|nr:BRO family protein [Acinetobacter sp. 256-1]MDM1758136.1 hypothetical protein [Acinetobacter sp. 256-1]
MSSLTLSFNEVKFNPIPQNDGQIWLSSAELAQALDYKQVDSVTKIFNRNSDEFDFTMTQTVNLTVSNKNNELQNVKTRIFSLRGCHLVAMFARTAVAKLFRKWALDVLAKEVGQAIAKTHKSEREPLTNAVNMLVAKTKHLNYSDAYKLVHQRFNVDHIEDIQYDAIPVAVEYVHHLITLYSNAEKKQFGEGDLQNLHALATHMIWARSWWSEFGDFVKKLNPTIYSRATSHFNDGSSLAWQFVKAESKHELKEYVDSFDWLTGTYRQKLPI